MALKRGLLLYPLSLKKQQKKSNMQVITKANDNVLKVQMHVIQINVCESSIACKIVCQAYWQN